jgi:hypothetical protein
MIPTPTRGPFATRDAGEKSPDILVFDFNLTLGKSHGEILSRISVFQLRMVRLTIQTVFPMRVFMQQNMRFFQAVFDHERFIGQKLESRGVGDDTAGIEENRSRAEAHDQFEIVCGDDLCGTESGKEGRQLTFAPRIKLAGRLVQNKGTRLAGQDAREADPAFLAAAQVMGRSLLESGEPDAFQRRADSGTNSLLLPAELLRAECNVIEDRRAKELVFRILEKQSDRAADDRQIGGRRRESE